MSLFTNPYVRTLWDLALSQPEAINPSQVFWQFVLSKYFFPELQYCLQFSWTPVSHQLLEQAHNTGRLNIVIQSIGASATNPISLICVVESGAPNSDALTIENIALDQCAEHVMTHGLSFVYAMTTVGTTAMLWKYHPRAGIQPRLEPLITYPTYIDADSPDIDLLENWFQIMKREPPR